MSTDQILVVEPSALERAAACHNIRALGYRPVPAVSPLGGIARLHAIGRGDLGAVAVAPHLSTVDGAAFLEFVAGEYPDIGRVLVWPSDEELPNPGFCAHRLVRGWRDVDELQAALASVCRPRDAAAWHAM